MTDAATGKDEQTVGEERWDSTELARRIAALADEKKAVGTVLVHVEPALQVADWFVITQGRNRRHLSVLAEHVAKELKQHGIYRLAGTPFNDENWVVLDFGSVVLHVFSPQAREFYDLENLWGECESIPWKPADARAPGDDEDEDEADDFERFAPSAEFVEPFGEPETEDGFVDEDDSEPVDDPDDLDDSEE